MRKGSVQSLGAGSLIEDMTLGTAPVAPPALPSERKFGLLFAGVFILCALAPLRHGAGIRLWAVVVAGILLVLGLLDSKILRLPNRLWAMLGHALHLVMSPLALGAIFFLVLTPFALCARLFGYDKLRLKSGARLQSFWVKRDHGTVTAVSMENQF